MMLVLFLALVISNLAWLCIALALWSEKCDLTRQLRETMRRERAAALRAIVDAARAPTRN